MSQFKISLIDVSLNPTALEKLLFDYEFEDLSEKLRQFLGPEYFVYEGNNHIDAHKIGEGSRLVFIERI